MDQNFKIQNFVKTFLWNLQAKGIKSGIVTSTEDKNAYIQIANVIHELKGM